jgi:hypothetical protein
VRFDDELLSDAQRCVFVPRGSATSAGFSGWSLFPHCPSSNLLFGYTLRRRGAALRSRRGAALLEITETARPAWHTAHLSAASASASH